MNDRRRALGRGLGALIPTDIGVRGRPVDTFFPAPPNEPVRDEDDFAVPPSDAFDAPTGETVADDIPAARVSVPGDGQAQEPPDNPGASASEVLVDPGAPALRPVPGAHFAQLAVDAIRPNPRQPRQSFDPEEMEQLVHSIRQIGVLQPIVVRPTGATQESTTAQWDVAFELVMGERRWRAAMAAGLERVPAIVKDTENDALLRDALLENLHRSQLNPLEEAAAYQQLLDDFDCTKEDLASRIGRSRPQVSNTLRLLGLPAPVQRRVAAGVLSAGHARALLGLSEGAAIERLAARIVAEGLSVRTVEEIVAMGAQTSSRRPTRRTEPDADLLNVAAKLSDRFDTRVHVAMGQRKGRLTIEFASGGDLERILDVMGVDLS